MMYAYIDGDDIGLRIENSFMDNNEENLKAINDCVKNAVNEITFTLTNLGYEIIFDGADGVICKSEKIDIHSLLNYVRQLSDKLTFSIGIGQDLRDSYIALRYAKSNGKNVAAVYNQSFKLIK